MSGGITRCPRAPTDSFREIGRVNFNSSTEPGGMNVGVLVQLEANAKPDCVEEMTEMLRQLFPETRAFDGCNEITAYLNDDGHTFVFMLLFDP